MLSKSRSEGEFVSAEATKFSLTEGKSASAACKVISLPSLLNPMTRGRVGNSSGRSVVVLRVVVVVRRVVVVLRVVVVRRVVVVLGVVVVVVVLVCTSSERSRVAGPSAGSQPPNGSPCLNPR